MDAEQVITKVGGAKKVATLIGSTSRNVHNWKHNGIPAKYWPALVKAAFDGGLDGITFDSLAAIHQKAPARLETKRATSAQAA